MRFSSTLRPPVGNGIDKPDGAWQASIGSLLGRVGGFKGAPPDDELPDQRAGRDMLRGESGEALQSKAMFDILQTGKNVIAVRPEIDRVIRGAPDHALFAEFGDVVFHRGAPGHRRGALRYGPMLRCGRAGASAGRLTMLSAAVGAAVTLPAVACACPAASSCRRGWPPHRAR